ncbi:MAG: hypothetical protein ACKOC7_03275, partial [Sphingomonadales bacterium]
PPPCAPAWNKQRVEKTKTNIVFMVIRISGVMTIQCKLFFEACLLCLCGGLSNEEARRVLASVGYNELGETKERGVLGFVKLVWG